MELFPRYPVLVVDDEKNYLKSIEFELLSNGITNVECCQDSKDVMPRLEKNTYSLILLDLIMPGISGKDLLPKVVSQYPGIPVIVITGAFPDNPKIPITKIASDCMKEGAFDFLNKPIEIKDLVKTIQDVLNLKVFYKEIIYVKKNLFFGRNKKPKIFSKFITKSEKMSRVFQAIGLLAFTSRPLLIRGEKGAGKEFAAQQIHMLGRRKGKFVSFHTIGLDDNSLQKKLLGKKSGTSFKKGQLEEARGGTLYIDDVGDLSKNSQKKLLHLIRKKEYFPQGAKEPVDADVRIIVGTKKNLTALAKIESFNQQLDFLLKTHEIYIPPLRERKEDISLLLKHFVNEAAKKIGIKTLEVPEEIFNRLNLYDFPGNTGELKKMVYEAVNRHKSGCISFDVINEIIKQSKLVPVDGIDIQANKNVIFRENLPTFLEMEAIYFDEVMKRAKGNRTSAAKLADMNIKAFQNRLKKIRRSRKKEKE